LSALVHEVPRRLGNGSLIPGNSKLVIDGYFGFSVE
jgi:hypothetical protein